jgi:phage-related protein
MVKVLKFRRLSVAEKWKMLAGIFVAMMVCVESASAAETSKTSAREDHGVAERLGEAAENVGKKIEQAVTGVAKQFEEQRVGERFVETIKKAGTKTGEELERVGKKIEDAFSKEP